jgi:DNA-binding transcriptional MerR regulator
LGRNTEGSEAGTGTPVLIAAVIERRYSTAELAKLTGLSARLLQTWHRRDIAPASENWRGEKMYLSYTADQAATVLALVDLHDRGMNWKVIARIAAFLPRPISAHQYLIVSETTALARNGNAATVSACLSLANLALVVGVEDLLSKIKAR